MTGMARPSAHARGYGAEHRRFRTAVLTRDPRCVLCGQPSAHADHWPVKRTELVRVGLNPNDPRHGRGLCHSCHSRETARHDGGYGNGQRPPQRRPPEQHPGLT